MALDGYCSPILRASVFRRLNPGVQINYEVIAIEDAFPDAFRNAAEGCRPPTHAVRCTAIFSDGTYVEAEREVDLDEQDRSRKWRPVEQTPEYLAKIQTKAMGRMLTRAGIPQKDYELQTLMRWMVALDGRPIANASVPAHVNPVTGEIAQPVAGAFAPMPSADEVDDPDVDDETVTPTQELNNRLLELKGPQKAIVAKWAREQKNISNVFACPPEMVAEVNTFLDELENT